MPNSLEPDMELDAQTQAVLDALAAMKLQPPDQIPIEEARTQFIRSRAQYVAAPEPVASAQDISIPGPAGAIPARAYRPSGSSPGERLPAFVFFHGGGWVFGNLDSHDSLCRSLCNAARCAVVAVDYRLAPEHRFPAALDDALAALRHVAQHATRLGIDASRLAAGGDSAGGNLVAVAALTFRDQGGPRLALQVLLYPVTDLSLESPSYATLGQGYMLTLDRMRFFRNQYLNRASDAGDWRASPLRAADLSRLPPALIVTASHDPLIDEAKAYADRLAAAGVHVTYRSYPGVVHGFMTMAGAVDTGRRAVEETAATIRTALQG
jgi:acetyl esterase